MTRSVTLPPWSQTTVIYVPPHDDEDDEDDDGIHPTPHPPPPITLSDCPGFPKCIIGCGDLCSDPFCLCLLGCGGDSDTGFADPNDPDPPSNPNDPDDPDDDDDEPTTTCSDSTVTNFWVSCETQSPTSTSCTTTSSMVAIGCDVTAETATTGVEVCYSVGPNDDQGEDGGTYTVTKTNPGTLPPTTTRVQPMSPSPSPSETQCSSFLPTRS